jgi:hypothetical protein
MVAVELPVVTCCDLGAGELARDQVIWVRVVDSIDAHGQRVLTDGRQERARIHHLELHFEADLLKVLLHHLGHVRAGREAAVRDGERESGQSGAVRVMGLAQ